MDLDAVLTAIEVHAQAAGAALDDPMTDVCIGVPVPRGRCGRIAWIGEEAPWDLSGDRALNAKYVGDVVLARFFWPVPTADEAASRTRIVEMWTIADELGSRIRSDTGLGGLVSGIDLEPIEADDLNIGGALFAIVDATVHISYRKQETTR